MYLMLLGMVSVALQPEMVPSDDVMLAMLNLTFALLLLLDSEIICHTNLRPGGVDERL